MIETVPLPVRVKNIANQKFGLLLAVELTEISWDHRAIWLCKCDCENTTRSRASDLIKGKSKSCGCVSIEKMKKRVITHHMTGTPIYKTWIQIKSRCNNDDNPAYKNYGGRGISVYKEWQDNFQEFFSYVSKLKHYNKKGYSLDRTNNSKGYQPGNVRFATRKEQSRNTRRNLMITYNNKTQCLKDWATELSINATTLYCRIRRSGWTIEKAFTEPIRDWKNRN